MQEVWSRAGRAVKSCRLPPSHVCCSRGDSEPRPGHGSSAHGSSCARPPQQAVRDKCECSLACCGLSRAWLFFSVVVCAQNRGTCFLLLQKLSGLLLSVQKSLCLSALVTQGSFVGSRLPDLDNYDLWYNFVLHWEWSFASLSLH